jgi:hypothetical protein
MRDAHRKPIGGALESPLGVQHIARGKALITTSVLADRDQFRRGFHRRHHAIELLLPVAMPVHEHGEIACRKGRLAVRDRVQGQRRPGEQFLAIGSRNFGMTRTRLGEPQAHRTRPRCQRETPRLFTTYRRSSSEPQMPQIHHKAPLGHPGHP